MHCQAIQRHGTLPSSRRTVCEDTHVRAWRKGGAIVIICNRCGKQVPAGLARCQNCGMSLSSVANKNMGAQEQDELPTWLESLRANERPAAPAGGQPGFSTADLIDDNDLPGWMRAQQAREPGEGDSGKHRAIRPAAM